MHDLPDHSTPTPPHTPLSNSPPNPLSTAPSKPSSGTASLFSNQTNFPLELQTNYYISQDNSYCNRVLNTGLQTQNLHMLQIPGNSQNFPTTSKLLSNDLPISILKQNRLNYNDTYTTPKNIKNNKELETILPPVKLKEITDLKLTKSMRLAKTPNNRNYNSNIFLLCPHCNLNTKDPNKWWGHLSFCLETNNCTLTDLDNHIHSLKKSKNISQSAFLKIKDNIEIAHNITFVKIPSRIQNKKTIKESTFLCNHKTNGTLDCPCFLACTEYVSNNKTIFWGAFNHNHNCNSLSDLKITDADKKILIAKLKEGVPFQIIIKKCVTMVNFSQRKIWINSRLS